MQIKRIIVVLALFALAGSARAQQAAQNLCDTIPFELERGKVIIPVRIGEHRSRFILDTGGRNLIMADSAQMLGLEIVGVHSVSDVNSAGVQFATAKLPNLRIGTFMKWDMSQALISPPNNFFRSLGVTGVLGGEAFSQVCLTIDMRARRLIVTYPYRPAGLLRGDAVKLTMSESSHTYAPIDIGGRTLSVLFDTGMSEFFNLSEDDHAKLAGAVDTVATGHGFLYVGIGGIKAAKPDTVTRVRVPSLKLGTKEYVGVRATTQKRGYSIIGLPALEYARAVIDYPRGMLYFLPYEDGPSDVDERTREWNVRVLPIVDHFEVTMTIGDAGVEFGERVWEINGVSLEGAELDESYVEQLLDQAEGDVGEIVVGADKKSLRKVLIRKI